MTAQWLRSRRFGYWPAALVAVIVAVVAFANYRAGLAETRRALDGLDPPGPQPAAEEPAAAPAADGVAAGSAVESGGTVAAEPAAASSTSDVDSSATAAMTRPEPLPPLPHRAIVAQADRVAKPASVRGLYVNAWAAGSSRKLDRLIGIAKATEVNTFVIDVKEGGEISYPSRVELAARIGAAKRYVPDIEGVLAKLKAAGIYPIARIVVFKDPVLAAARPEYAIRRRDGGQWIDNHGDSWVDSYNREVWDYNIEIAREAIELGFSEVQWDYVRFPDVPRSYMATAVWPAAAGRTKEDAIREFLRYSREQLSDLGAPVTADVFGLTVSAQGDMGIGQQWEKMLDATDVLLPMIYPSHFARGSYGIVYPNSEPYRTVKTALEHARRRTDGVPGAAAIRPWLQDFTLGKPSYSAAHVRAQIRATGDAGIDEWVLWNPGSNYTVEALADLDGTAPGLPIPDRVWQVEPKPVTSDTLRASRDTAVVDTIGGRMTRDTVVVDTIRGRMTRDTVVVDTIRARATRDTVVVDTIRARGTAQRMSRSHGGR